MQVNTASLLSTEFPGGKFGEVKNGGSFREEKHYGSFWGYGRVTLLTIKPTEKSVCAATLSNVSGAIEES
jgi:hypothetical protein